MTVPNEHGLRDVLTEAIKAHQVYQCSRSGWDEESIQWWQCHGCDFKSNTFPIKGINRVVLGEEIAADHLAEVILSLPGVAVIQLPEPDGTDNAAQTFYADYGIRVDNSVSGREGRIWTDFGLGTEFKCEMNAAGAMWWAKMFAAAAHAAAAVVAEGEDK